MIYAKNYHCFPRNMKCLFQLENKQTNKNSFYIALWIFSGIILILAKKGRDKEVKTRMLFFNGICRVWSTE